ncbi:serine protease, partial [Planococcus sp. SIMBA_143]
MEQLQLNRKDDPLETGNREIPVIVYLNSDCEHVSKDDLLKTCNKESHNKLEKELATVNGIRGYLTPGKIKQIKDHNAVDRIFHDRIVTA